MVPIIEGVDTLIEVTQTQDVGLIKNDTNSVSQRRAPRLEVRLPQMFDGHTTRLNADRSAPEEEHSNGQLSGVDTMTSPPTTSPPSRIMQPY